MYHNFSYESNEGVDDNLEEMLRIGAALRQAQDEDVMQALNTQSSKKDTDVNNLFFFVIAANWMRRSWPILFGRAIDSQLSASWREDLIGRIVNEDLITLSSSTNVISSEIAGSIRSSNSYHGVERSGLNELAKKAKTLCQNPLSSDSGIELLDVHEKKLVKQQHQCHRMRRDDIQVNSDYFLVGSNVWLLLKEKFGYDYEVRLRCQFSPQGAESCLEAVVLESEDVKISGGNISSTATLTRLPEVTIPIPLSGRFPYEEFLGTKVALPAHSVSIDTEYKPIIGPLNRTRDDKPTSMTYHLIPVKPADQNHLGASSNEHQPKQPSVAGNNVSDDEEDYDTKRHDASHRLLSSGDGTTSNSDPEANSPIILLPSSTTDRSTIENNIHNEKVVSRHAHDSASYWQHDTPDIYDSNNNDESTGAGAMEDGYNCDDDERDYDDDDDDDKASYSDIIQNNNAVVGPRLRLYGSGLGNLGNTCFMNSTLQCLAHTEPLQRYFLSGVYKNDLNRANPLGTGGELAMQFASLLSEMYVVDPIRSNYSNNTRTTRNSSSYASSDYGSTLNVVYPRNFKATLGKHAEQFMGYDQHDSQELATYLLDALHEDTNRVTVKPYIEKPEQADNETDEDAAKKAWDLHLKREDSKVLENFMGLVKSRVECCTEGCGRVSTTFDPVMYLSVPIPGSSERVIQVTFVPLDPLERPKILMISILKTANVEDLLKKLRVQLNDQFPSLSKAPGLPLLEDLCPTDIWQKEVHSWLTHKDEVDKIRDNDVTFVYELRPTKEIRRQFDEKQALAGSTGDDIQAVDDADALRLGIPIKNREKCYRLDLATLTQLNRGDAWIESFQKYLQNPTQYHHAFHVKKGSSEARVRIYRQLLHFLDSCQRVVDEITSVEDNASTGQKRTREENEEGHSRLILVSGSDEQIDAIVDKCYSDRLLKDVARKYDLAVLEFISGKMRQEILNLERRQKNLFPNGIIVEICMRRMSSYHGEKETNIVAPFVLRIPSDMTVYQLRQELAKRLQRSLRTPSRERQRQESFASTGQSTAEVVPSLVSSSSFGCEESKLPEDHTFGSPDLLIIRRLPLSYERKGSSSSYRPYSASIQLGSIGKVGAQGEVGRLISLASENDTEEKALVSENVSNHDRLYVDWPPELIHQTFDQREFESADEPVDNGTRTPSKSKTKTVLDCIDKFCQKEQLEETEQWYCNKCQQHVRAWKQFHIYKSPPHLIVHLKRFHYSPTTHRRNKINTLIDFPLEGLDLRLHVSHWSEEANDKPIYDCYAVTNHYGGLGGGHYTAYALNPDGVWCLYDDSKVTSHVDPKEVVSQAAYVLYYRRRDVPTGQDFEVNPQTVASDGRGVALVVSPTAPAIIQNDPESKGQTTPSSEISSCASNSSSNVAMIGDDDQVMDDMLPHVINSNEDDDDDLNDSRATSPMDGSMVDDPIESEQHHIDIEPSSSMLEGEDANLLANEHLYQQATTHASQTSNSRKNKPSRDAAYSKSLPLQ